MTKHSRCERKSLPLAAVAALLTAIAPVAHAQSPAFPAKPVRIVVAFPPGFVMVAHPSLPAKNVKELIALAKSRPGQINYSSSGPGGAPHLGGELLKSMAVPGYELTNWFGLVVPSATPRELIARLHGDVSKVLQQPDVRDRIQGMGGDVIGSSPADFAAFMRGETSKWAKVVKQANIRAE